MKKRRDQKKALFYWIPVLLWAGLIFYLSGISALSSGLSTPVEIVLRKIAHAFEYGILALLLLQLAHKGYGLAFKRSMVISFLATLLYALSDELHQSFVLERHGNLRDVAVDLIGAYIILKFASIVEEKAIRAKEAWKIIIAVALFAIVTFWQVSIFKKLQQEELRMEAAREDVAKEIENQESRGSDEQQRGPLAVIEEAAEGNVEKPSVGGTVIPDKILIDVPFSSQAPFGVWDEVHEEACEEMSLIMVKYYLDGKKLTKETAEREILALKDFQEKKYGHFVDSSMEELVDIGREFYGMENFKVIYDFGKDELKEQLAKGKPIIVPTAGRMLGNPNFTPPGPLYHNLVLVGYDGNTIITNDPGTRKGEGYTYSLDVLYSAIHDFEGSKEQISRGRKAMIILE